ncbi:hypothetical protein LSAT2_003328 [Lamellibrachia satsuma]|nr:hypothetical protein LSAT2_003328 [Lamellibrachia satsuma]
MLLIHHNLGLPLGLFLRFNCIRRYSSLVGCDPNCNSCDNNGLGLCDPNECTFGYVFDRSSKTCLQCTSNCMSCVDRKGNGEMVCAECEEEYMLNDAQCHALAQGLATCGPQSYFMRPAD